MFGAMLLKSVVKTSMIYNYMYYMYTHTERQDRLHESRQGGTEAAAEQLGELQALHNFLGKSQGFRQNLWSSGVAMEFSWWCGDFTSTA